MSVHGSQFSTFHTGNCFIHKKFRKWSKIGFRQQIAIGSKYKICPNVDKTILLSPCNIIGLFKIKIHYDHIFYKIIQ